MELLDGPKGQTYVRIDDLAREIGLSPEETWVNFCALAETVPRSADLETIKNEEDRPDFANEVIFVPARWAFEVKRVHAAGAYSAQAIYCPSNSLPKGTYKVMASFGRQMAIVLFDRDGHPVSIF